MKIHALLCALVVTAGLIFTGCSKSGGNASVDPAPVEKSFAGADATLKAAADKAVAAIKSADYSNALAELQKLGANAKLTDDQKKAISDVLAQVQKALVDTGNKVAGEANKALGDVQKSLGK